MNGIKIQHSTMFFMINPEATNTMTFNLPYHNLGIQNGKNHASQIMYTSKPSTARRLLFDNPHGGGKEVPLDVSNISTNKVNLYTEQSPKNPLKASIDFRKEILLRFKQLNRVQCDKWNFDFRREQPLPGPYQWQRCVKRKFGVNLHINNNNNTLDNIIANTVTSSPRKTFRRNVSPPHIAESTDRFDSLLRMNLNPINTDAQKLLIKPGTPLNIQNGDSRILSALQSRAGLSDDLLMVGGKNLDPKPDNLLEHLEGMPCFNLKCEKCDDINADKTNLTTTYQSKITDFFPVKKSSMFRPHTLENAKMMSFHYPCQPQPFINSKQTLENFMECSGKATLENKLNSLMMDCTVPPPT